MASKRQYKEAAAQLEGLEGADQQSILDDFDKRGPGITQPPLPAASVDPAVPTPTAPAVPAISNISAASTSVGGAIATSSREDVLTRAAALGRGAATTGFKRFLALTEAAKDRKDGPFRKFFNA
ncbi:vacuolar protein sorting-associated protein 53 A-like isoform X2 [Actinidia eriantha]|nr:vacuolar protein sorting-associated protein 53 A-like isoform X2 [Actinidia eriantha]